MNDNVPVVFLVCAGRAGGGFLQSLLDSHPQVLMLPMEFSFHLYWDSLNCDDIDSPDEMARTWLEDSKLTRFETGILYGIEKSQNDYTNCDYPQFAENLRELLRQRGIARKSVFLAIHEAYAKTIGQDLESVEVIVEFPGDPGKLQPAFDDFPQCRIMEVVRDPRAIYSSMKTGYMNSCGNLVNKTADGYSSVLMFVLDTLSGSYARMQLHRSPTSDERWCVVRHEDLHLSNEATMVRVAEWLGINTLPCLYESTIGGHPWQGNSSTLAPVTGVQPEIVKRWRSSISSFEKRFVERFFSDVFERYDYSTESDDASKLSVFFSPIKGELFLTIKKTRPEKKPFTYLWKIHPWIVYLVRYGIVGVRKLDRVLLAPYFFVKFRLWILKYL